MKVWRGANQVDIVRVDVAPLPFALSGWTCTGHAQLWPANTAGPIHALVFEYDGYGKPERRAVYLDRATMSFVVVPMD